jgi:hypothetical protein
MNIHVDDDAVISNIYSGSCKMRMLLLDIRICIIFLLIAPARLLSFICILGFILNDFENNLSLFFYFLCFWLVLIFLNPNFLKIY